MKAVLIFVVCWFLFSYSVAGSRWEPSDAVWISLWAVVVVLAGLLHWRFTKGKKTGPPDPRHHEEFDEPV